MSSPTADTHTKLLVTAKESCKINVNFVNCLFIYYNYIKMQLIMLLDPCISSIISNSIFNVYVFSYSLSANGGFSNQILISFN